MFEKRLRGYRAIGYARGEAPLGFSEAKQDLIVEYDEDARHADAGESWAQIEERWPPRIGLRRGSNPVLHHGTPENRSGCPSALLEKGPRGRHVSSVPPSDRVQRIIELADELPVDERRELELALLDHDVSDAEAKPLPDWLRDELDRRLAEDTSA